MFGGIAEGVVEWQPLFSLLWWEAHDPTVHQVM